MEPTLLRGLELEEKAVLIQISKASSYISILIFSILMDRISKSNWPERPIRTKKTYHKEPMRVLNRGRAGVTRVRLVLIYFCLVKRIVRML